MALVSVKRSSVLLYTRWRLPASPRAIPHSYRMTLPGGTPVPEPVEPAYSAARWPTPVERYWRYKRMHLLRHALPPGPGLTGDGRVVVNKRLHQPLGTDLLLMTNDTYGGDSDLWTGVLLSTLALEYGLSHDRALLEPIRAILDAYEWLENRQNVLPEEPGYVPRAIELDLGAKAEPSGDQYTGILVGLTLVHRFVTDPEVRERVENQANRMGHRMQRDWYFIFRPQGGLSSRGAEVVQWEYTWGLMFERITGNRYRSHPFTIERFWHRLSSRERDCVVRKTAKVYAVLGGMVWALSSLHGRFWDDLVTSVSALLATAVPGQDVRLVIAFLVAIFSCLHEAPMGVLLHLLAPNSARNKHHIWIGLLNNDLVDVLNQLDNVYDNIRKPLKKIGIRVPRMRDWVKYYNFHITFLSTFGAFFERDNPDRKLLDLYRIRIMEKQHDKDHNAVFSLIVRALYSTDDQVARLLDVPGVFPLDYLPTSRDERSSMHDNYAWQTEPAGRLRMTDDWLEWPGLDFMFPIILRAYLDKARVPVGSSPVLGTLI